MADVQWISRAACDSVVEREDIAHTVFGEVWLVGERCSDGSIKEVSHG